jgi:UDP-glucuronate 4-epimerase
MALYLITGAAGFIGSRVSMLLLQQGHQVIGVDDLNDSYDVRLKRHRLRLLGDYQSFSLLQLNVADTAQVEEGLHSIETPAAILSLAARSGVRQSVAAPWAYFHTNVTGTINLLDFCRRRGVKKFVLASSSSVYGAQDSMPHSEECETSRPLSPYAASKKAAEALCHSYHHIYELDVSILRYFTVYGPAGRPDMSVFRFIQRIYEGQPILIYGNGSQSRDFTYVDDVASATLMALKTSGYTIFNVGSGCPVSILKIVTTIEEVTGRKSLVQNCAANSADVPATWADISKARQVLGWKPQTRYQEGLRAACEWYQANREWARQVLTLDGGT